MLPLPCLAQSLRVVRTRRRGAESELPGGRETVVGVNAPLHLGRARFRQALAQEHLRQDLSEVARRRLQGTTLEFAPGEEITLEGTREHGLQDRVHHSAQA